MLKGNSQKNRSLFEKNLTTNSDASAALKLLAQFSSASFTLCIVATLRKALAIIGGDDEGAVLFRIERNQRAVNALKAPLGG